MVQITRKIESFLSFTTSSLPFVTYPKNIIKIHPKIMLQPGSRSLKKYNHLFLVPLRSFAENVITIHPQLSDVSVLLHFMDPEDPYSGPDHQNSATSSLYLFRHILKISSKSIHKFLSYIVHKHIWQPGSR